MSWIALIIKVNASYAELLSDVLMEQGAQSVDIHDAAADTEEEQMLFGEPGEPGGEIWQNAEVTALFGQDVELDQILQNITQAVQLDRQPEYRLEYIEEQDWVRLTQSQFDPIQISSRLWIVPTWHQLPDLSAINLILDPGLAFGTGSHPTTRLCLSWLDQNIRSGDTVVDYGCGSGILAIAALKLGAERVIGIDIDNQAIKASEENALCNQCDPEKFVFAVTHRVIEQCSANGQADVVVANILANPLIMLAPVLSQILRKEGRIVLSGILQSQAIEVKNTYQQWFEMCVADTQEGWVLLTGIKK